jgi:hypothetical protein
MRGLPAVQLGNPQVSSGFAISTAVDAALDAVCRDYNLTADAVLIRNPQVPRDEPRMGSVRHNIIQAVEVQLNMQRLALAYEVNTVDGHWCSLSRKDMKRRKYSVVDAVDLMEAQAGKAPSTERNATS